LLCIAWIELLHAEPQVVAEMPAPGR
jgi:hypothetical protein